MPQTRFWGSFEVRNGKRADFGLPQSGTIFALVWGDVCDGRHTGFVTKKLPHLLVAHRVGGHNHRRQFNHQGLRLRVVRPSC